MSNSNDLRPMMISLWQSACQDAPKRPSARVEDGHFVLTITGNRSAWGELVRAAGVPDGAEQAIRGDTLTVRWPSVADQIFGSGGHIAALLTNYEPRAPQLYMARLVQRAIEMGEPAIVEAGTGTGKSFAYAAVCMALDKKVIISTSNKALQAQLIDKDLPFLCSLFPGTRVAVSVGKGNYACRLKCDQGVADPALAEWYAATTSGNTEEIPFAPDYKALQAMTVDDDCTGKYCPFYADCFYYAARAALQDADVIVTNHALLCIDHAVGGHILPPADVVVVDEAHKLADYARGALGVEITIPQIRRTINLALGFADDTDAAANAVDMFERELAFFLRGKDDPQVGVSAECEFTAGQNLAESLHILAAAVWPEEELPSNAEEKRAAKRAQRIRNMADKVAAMAQQTRSGFVRWIDQGRGAEPAKLCAQPFDVSEFVGGMAGIEPLTRPSAPDRTRCARCNRTLSAEKVAVLDGRPYGPDCIHYVDALGDAETVSLGAWLASEHAEMNAQSCESTRAVIFCSATLAAPDMAHFLHTNGIGAALQMIAASPFDYAENALLYLPSSSAPPPNDPAWPLWSWGEMRSLVLGAGGGAFLLFTSYRALNEALHELRYTFTARGLTVLVQGEMPKMEIVRRFKEDGDAVLFATKSFFEGVSIDGHALRLVVIDKMPFEAPSPLTQAMEADLLSRARAAGMTGKTLEMYPFNALRVPRMIIELKQGAGRLIRTATDKGVIAVLDSRVRASMYGRNAVIPALPPAPLTSRTEQVAAFFGMLPPLPPALVAMPSEVRAEKAAEKRRKITLPAAVSEEIPF